MTLGTLAPPSGTIGRGEYGSAETNAQRELVNAWIRNHSGPEAVADFDAVTRDPRDSSRLNPEYDSSDHLHPNTAGYRAMAAAIDLAAFRGSRCAVARHAYKQDAGLGEEAASAGDDN